jgi:hypothetical protein
MNSAGHTQCRTRKTTLPSRPAGSFWRVWWSCSVRWSACATAIALPVAWLGYATWSQWGDPDEWLAMSLAVLPCIAIVGVLAAVRLAGAETHGEHAE